MGTPEDVLPLSVLYMKIFFVGMPATLIYNFGSAVLRAVGDTRKAFVFSFGGRGYQCYFESVFCDCVFPWEWPE